MAGTYQYNARVNIDCAARRRSPSPFRQGRQSHPRLLVDAHHAHSDNPEQGIRLTGSYWHFFRIDITGQATTDCCSSAQQTYWRHCCRRGERHWSGSRQHHQAMQLLQNGGTGLQIKNLGAYNKIINCDSYLNCDEGQGDADGFCTKDFCRRRQLFLRMPLI